ncbi:MULTISPECIES: cytochrome-c oxidase, cbb3-type subunit III [unclassified Roseitalea]|uniref:cytochrome-c oxidase, cbb3-type subunit III n=1 Tax=unclassified Roseitalea TaxID=2639107 RepID=UPI0027401ADE|nr:MULTISPECIES: cytochrome-c oxidase, cbb3-type subunit III [unclassified Roseitalea]
MAEDKKDIDEISGVETTGHEWDGIKELNNPLPRWWLWTFYATIIWTIGYTILYPAWPGITGATAGVLGWTSRGQLAEEMQAARAEQSVWLDRIDQAEVTEIAADPELVQFAVAGGSSAFKVYCVQCHGSGAQGSPGYPNLNDDEWIWGGSLEEIAWTIRHGVRYEPDFDTRFNEMPAYGRDDILSRQEISDVAWYVRQISGQEYDEEAAARGAETFEIECSACHGIEGEGVPELGGPALNDAIWLYGGSHEQIVAQINNPQMGVMPAWGERLGETTIKQLAVYVHQLGGGQ